MNDSAAIRGGHGKQVGAAHEAGYGVAYSVAKAADDRLAVAALAADPDVMSLTGRSLTVAELADRYHVDVTT